MVHANDITVKDYNEYGSNKAQFIADIKTAVKENDGAIIGIYITKNGNLDYKDYGTCRVYSVPPTEICSNTVFSITNGSLISDLTKVIPLQL